MISSVQNPHTRATLPDEICYFSRRKRSVRWCGPRSSNALVPYVTLSSVSGKLRESFRCGPVQAAANGWGPARHRYTTNTVRGLAYGWAPRVSAAPPQIRHQNNRHEALDVYVPGTYTLDMSNAYTKQEAIEMIAHLEACKAACDKAGLVGAVLDNERAIRRLQVLWGLGPAWGQAPAPGYLARFRERGDG